MKIVFLLVMECAIALVLTVLTLSAKHPEDRQAPKAKTTDTQEVCVLGNVGNPSAIPFQGTISLADAIRQAGGALPNVRANRVNIVRRLPNSYVQVIRVKDLEKKGPSLRANDIIDVFPKRKTQKGNYSMSPPCGAWFRLFKSTM